MKKIKAIIIDDEPLAHRIIERFSADIPYLDIVGKCYSATESYAILSSTEINLIFLDIQMPRLTGLDFLRTLEYVPHIVITSAFEEYALEGFELQVSDYLLKPFSFERFLKAIQLVHANLELRNTFDKGEKTVFIKVDKRQIQIEISEIHCLESYGNYVKIWLSNDMYLTPRTLMSFEEELTALTFQRVHKSFILNKDFVDYVEGNMIVLKNKMIIPIGKNYRQEVKTWF